MPSTLRGALEPALGVDLFGVEVKRGAGAMVEARRLGARAFTAGDRVHLPAAQGSLVAEPARSLLVHELTHVAQQRRLGPTAPSEESPAGRALEAEARSLERVWRMAASPAPHAAAMPAEPVDQPSASEASSAPAPGSSPSVFSDGVGHVQRAEGDAEPAAPTSLATSPPTASGGGGDLDQLADQLFPRIRGRFLAELRDHRERSGTLVDQ